MSLRLSAALGTSADFWLRMQVQRDLWLAQKERRPKIRPFPHVAVLGGLPQVTESCEAKSF
jgi:plasmid maintenance system antidote protein VapI